MKVAVLNFSGNVGKTTVARALLAPRIPDATLVAVESINAEDGQVGTLRGSQYATLQDMLMVNPQAIVDIGASNVETLLERMGRYSGAQDDFDYYIVPTVPDAKQQRDTVSTLFALTDLGVPPAKLRIVFNRWDREDGELASVFERVIGAAQTHLGELNLQAYIRRNELFDMLKEGPESVADLVADTKDYKAAIAQTADPDQKIALSRQLGKVRLARGITPELDRCFAALTLSPAN